MKARLQNCSGEENAWDSKKSLIMTAGLGMGAETHGGCPTMNAGAHQILQVAEQAQKTIHSNSDRRTNATIPESAARMNGGAVSGTPRVRVLAPRAYQRSKGRYPPPRH